MRSHRLVAGLAVALALSGCATVPTGGPVHQGSDTGSDRAEPAVRIIGRPPVKGADPKDVVTGFLQASADLTDGSATAREFLAPEAASSWSPAAGVTVYDRGVLPPLTEGGSDSATATVALDGTQVAAVDAGGHYTPSSQGAPLERQFRLRKVDGEWRIINPGEGLLLTAEDLNQAYRRVEVYFVSTTGTVLVPDPVFVPAQPQLATELVSRVTAGVPAGLLGAAMSSLPRGTTIVGDSVPVRGGVAQVSLRTPSGLDGNEARRELSAQLVWTLKQLTEVQAVHDVVDGSEIRLDGSGADQPVTSWASFDPAGLTEGSIAYAVRGTALGRIDATKFSPVPGPAGDGRVPIRRPAVSLDARQVATVNSAGTAVSVGTLTDDATFTPRLTGGTDLSPPSWDLLGDLWVVDRLGGSSRLWKIPPAGAAEAVAVPPVAAGPLQLVRVARDGARVAVLAGPTGHATLLVGRVVRSSTTTRLAGLRPVLPDLTDVQDVEWADATTLAAIGRRGPGLPAPLYVDVDGAAVRSVEQPPTPLVSIAAAPDGRPLIGASAKGALYQLSSGRSWAEVGLPPRAGGAVFRDPTYPG